MGNCINGDGGEPRKMTDDNTVKLIILGISGCGKTTFTKQMKILHNDGFRDFEVDNFKKNYIKKYLFWSSRTYIDATRK